MARHVAGYEDEWAAVLADPERLRRFVSFVNAPGTPDPSIAFVAERGQPRPADLPLAAGGGAAEVTRDRLICWTAVCRYDDLQPERGVAALIDGEQVALFRTFDGTLYAIGNQDPFTGAFVLSRGHRRAPGATSPPSRPRCTSRSSTFAPGSAWTTRRRPRAVFARPGARRPRRGGGRVSGETGTLSRVSDEVGPLAGYTVGITAARRREEFAAALERRGAKVVSAPAIRIVPLADDSELRAATRALPGWRRSTSSSPPPASGSAAGWRPPTPGAWRRS